MKLFHTCISVLFGFLLFNSGNLQSQSNTDSLITILENSSDDKEKIALLIRIAEQNLEADQNINQARDWIWEAYDICVKKSIDIPVELHIIKARLLNEMLAPRDALVEIEKALRKIPTENVSLLAKARNYRAYYLLRSGQIMDALKQYESNLAFADSNDLQNASAKALLGLANANNAISDRKMEIAHLNQYITRVQSMNDSSNLAMGYFRLGEAHLLDSIYQPAEENFLIAYQIRSKLNDTLRMTYALLRVAWVKYLDGDLDQSISYFEDALQLARECDAKQSITNALGNLGTIYRDLKLYDEALKNYKESIAVSMEVRDLYNLSWVYNDMSSMYNDMADYKNAYHYYQLYKSYNDSLENERFRLGLERARTLFETEKKQQELEMLSLKLKQHQNFLWGLGGLIVLLTLIALLIIRQTRISSKKRISEMNSRISELTLKNLRQQMNPHFIFNTLNSIQYYMYQHDKIATNDYMSKFSSLMRKTLENSRHTSIPIKDELDALTLYLELEALRFKHKFSYVIAVDDEIDLLMHKIPTMLIQPYVENAIGHGLMHKEGSDGLVKIKLKLNETTIICTVQDNGIGREAAHKINLSNKNHHSMGTTITESRLKIVNSLYGKNMRIDYFDLKTPDDSPAGTKVVIHIPIIT
jgi:tetratricopeptide (TPR) repeat protein